MTKQMKSFFRLAAATESASELPTDISLVDAPAVPVVDAATVPDEVAQINATEENIALLDSKAASLDVLAQIAEEIPNADEHHCVLTELAAVEAVRGTDIDPATEVVPSMESAVGGKIPTAHIRATADKMRKASQALRLGLKPATESIEVVPEQPAWNFTPSTEGVGADIAASMRKLFSTWKESPDENNPWKFGSKEIVDQLQKTYGNKEWVEMRGLKTEAIKLPRAAWPEYLIYPGDKLVTDNISLLVPMVRSACDFLAEMCSAFESYKKDLTPIYNKMLSQDPEVALEYVRGELEKIQKPAQRMTIKDLPLPAHRHIKLTEGGNFIDDWKESEVPAEIPALKDVNEVLSFAKALIDGAHVCANTKGTYPYFFGHDRYDWWNRAYHSLSETDFNYLWRNFYTNNVHAANGLETAGIKAYYSGVMALCAIDYVLDRSVK